MYHFGVAQVSSSITREMDTANHSRLVVAAILLPSALEVTRQEGELFRELAMRCDLRSIKDVGRGLHSRVAGPGSRPLQ